MADEFAMMPGRNGGRLRVGGPGRPPSQAAIAIREARYELKASLDALIAIRDAGKCKHCGRGASSADEIVKAAMGILKLSGIEKEKPRRRKRSTFSVVTASAVEQAAKLAKHVADTAAPVASS
jgi:hypothetical protein